MPARQKARPHPAPLDEDGRPPLRPGMASVRRDGPDVHLTIATSDDEQAKILVCNLARLLATGGLPIDLLCLPSGVALN